MCNIDQPRLVDRSRYDSRTHNISGIHDESSANMITNTKTEGKKEGEKWNKKPSVVEDKAFSSKVSKYFIVYFDEVAHPTRKIHSFIPLIVLMRSVMISISVFALVSIPFLQVSLVLCIEISYTMIVVIFNNKNEVGAKVLDMTSSVINSIYVMFKFVTLFDIDDDTRQEIIGTCMVVLLVANLIASILYVVYSVGILLVDIVKDKCKDKDEEKERMKSNEESRIWCRKFIYEYTRTVSIDTPVQADLLPSQPVQTPIVVDPPVVNKGIIPKKNPVRGMRSYLRPYRVMNTPAVRPRVTNSPLE